MLKTEQIISNAGLISVLIFSAVVTNGCFNSEVSKTEELKGTIQFAIIEAWNKGNIDALNKLYAPDFIRHRPPFPDYTGLDAHKERVAMIRGAYPDHETIIHDIIIEGNLAAIWYTWQGTHTGEGLSLPPTGKFVKVPGCDIYRFENGKVVEEWDHEGFLSLFQQLGYIIEPPEIER